MDHKAPKLPDDIIRYLIATPPVIHSRLKYSISECDRGCIACEFLKLRAKSLDHLRTIDQLTSADEG